MRVFSTTQVYSSGYRDRIGASGQYGALVTAGQAKQRGEEMTQYVHMLHFNAINMPGDRWDVMRRTEGVSPSSTWAERFSEGSVIGKWWLAGAADRIEKSAEKRT